MTDNRKAGPDVLGASEALACGPKFIISACKNQSPFHFVATLIHHFQLCSVRIQLGFDAPAHQSGGLGLADVLFVLCCPSWAPSTCVSHSAPVRFRPPSAGACSPNLAGLLLRGGGSENHTAGPLA